MAEESDNKNQQLPAIPETISGSYVQRRWKWTKRRRQAARLVVQGMSDSGVAKEIGVHRCTVFWWRHRAEFMNYVMELARDYVTQRRFKRVHETGMLADHLYSESLRRMADLAERSLAPEVITTKKGQTAIRTNMTRDETFALQTFLKEYREFRGQERADFGDDVKRFEGVLKLTADGTPKREGLTGSAGAQSFQDFLAEHADKLPQRALTDPQTTLIETTRDLVRTTGILDAMAEEEEQTGLPPSPELDTRHHR